MPSSIETPIDLTDLRAQLEQELDTTKTIATLYVSWFTFFLTVNYVALGWFTSTMVKGDLNDPIHLYAMTGNFVVQLVLGMAASLICRKWALGSEGNSKAILSRVKELTPPEAHVLTFRRGHFATFMSQVYILCTAEMGFLVITWFVMALHATEHGRNPHASGSQTPAVHSLKGPDGTVGPK